MPAGRSRRRGVSAVVGELIMIGVVLSVGFALWGFVNSETGFLIDSFSEQSAKHANQLREKFLIVNVAFDYPVSGNATFWFYNNGNVTISIIGLFYGESKSSLIPIPLNSSIGLSPGEVKSVSLQFSFAAGTGYYFKAYGKYGNAVTHFEEA